MTLPIWATITRPFTQMVDFWRELVPDWFYEVQYEALVANPEEESRKLISRPAGWNGKMPA